MTLAVLFAGQGTQHGEMLRWLDAAPAAGPLLARVAAAVGADWRARLADPSWAERNAVAQPLLTGLALAAWQVLEPLLPAPAVVAGYSVGELAAFAAAGVLDPVQAVALAAERADAMDRSAAGADTGLLAVQGLGAGPLADACARHGLTVAIRLAPDRAVLGGLAPDLTAAEAALSAAGVRCTRLAVRIASHTPWMAAAAVEFEARLDAVALSPPGPLLVCNHSGAAERDPRRLRQRLARQIDSTVQWQACLDAVAERRVGCVLEIGGGHALAQLWRDRFPDVPARSADEFRDAGAVARWVAAALR